MTQQTLNSEALWSELKHLKNPVHRLSADLKLRHLISELAHRIEQEDSLAFALWTWLPSYTKAQAEHGDYAGEFRPSNLEVMDEAAQILGGESVPAFLPNGENPYVRLWSVLPSYREAVRYHGEEALSVAPYPEDVMKEACVVFGDLRSPDLKEDETRKAERAEWYQCPCGDLHDLDESED